MVAYGGGGVRAERKNSEESGEDKCLSMKN